MLQHTPPRTRERSRTKAPTSRAEIALTPLTALAMPARKLRHRKGDRIRSHADRIEEHRFDPPILALRSGEIIFGEDTAEAYRLLERSDVPVIYVDDRPPEQVAALRLWLERHHAEGDWDLDAVKAEFELICELDPEWLDATHWDMADIDLALQLGAMATGDDGDDEALTEADQPVVTREGDVWVWPTGHRLICGNARDHSTVTKLMDGATAHLLAADPPFGTSVATISRSHKEWKEGSGMSEPQSITFFEEFLQASLAATRDGALVYLFIDWKGLFPLLTAVRSVGLEQKTLCTWDKQSAGMGGLYRNQSEHIVVAKHGKAKSIDNVRLGAKRKGRSTIWSVPGYAGFRPDRKQALQDHACTKPQALLMDILLDASNPGHICLDPFVGSGSMILAAQRTKRICYGCEIEERFCDIAVRRMFELAGSHPTHAELGLPYNEVAAQRGVSLSTSGDVADNEPA